MAAYGGPSHNQYGYRPPPPPPNPGNRPNQNSSGGCLAAGCGCLILLVGMSVISSLLPLVGDILSVVFMLPGMVILAGFAFSAFVALHGVVEYLRRLASAMGIGRSPDPVAIASPPDKASDKEEPAFVHYLFGPALADLKHVARKAVPAPLDVGRRYDARLRGFFHGREPAWLMMPTGFALWAARGIGVIGGLVAVVLLCCLQLPLVLLLWLAVLAAGLVLRGLDRAMRRVKGIRTRCQSCHLAVPYPSYECTEPGCGRVHRDVRPGRYGIVKRRCGCGAKLPTLLILGSGDGRMRARCPHCGESMSKGVGTMPEIVIPVLGAATTGKTRLMTALVMGLLDGPAGHGAQTVFADEESKSAYQGLADKLRSGVHTWKTIKAKGAPLRAYSLHLRPPSGRPRLVHIFDAPGEMIGQSKLLQELRYIKGARTFLFTLDLLSIDAVWESLAPEERAKYGQLRSDTSPGTDFDRIVDNIRGHGVRTDRARLAVALTKDDLVRDGSALSGVGEDSDEIRGWLKDSVGLDGMVRLMDRSFDEVRFFRTSSWLTDGELDGSVLDLAGWVLVKEGLRVHHIA